MALITKAIKGTKDVLPQDAYKIQYIEATARETAADFGYKEIRTPVFEHTELFQRGVGDTTDVVQKEMYTFDDKGTAPLPCARRALPVLPGHSWRTGCATRLCPKRSIIWSAATGTRSLRPVACGSSTNSVWSASAPNPPWQTLN